MGNGVCPCGARDALVFGGRMRPGSIDRDREAEMDKMTDDAKVCSSNRMLTTSEAAQLLGVKPATLRSWKCRGLGPELVKYPGVRGAVRYCLTDIEEFLASCRHTPSMQSYVSEEMKRVRL